MPRISALVVLLALPLAAGAQDLPRLKAGLWEMTNTSSQRPGQPMKSTVCLDATLQQDMIRMGTGMMQGMCSKHELKVSGNKVTGEAICNLGQSKMTSRSVMTMMGDTAYRTEAHAKFDPPMMGTAQSETVIEGRYLGACRQGQRAGDMTMPNGQTMNIRNMMSGQK
jgi:hypothetical protein